MKKTFERNRLISDSDSEDDSMNSSNEHEKDDSINSSIEHEKGDSINSSNEHEKGDSISSSNVHEKDDIMESSASEEVSGSNSISPRKILTESSFENNNSDNSVIDESLNYTKNVSNNNSDDNKENVIDESNIVKDDSFKNFLENKKNDYFTSSPYESSVKKGISKENRISIDDTSRISMNVIKPDDIDVHEVIISDSGASDDSDLEIIEDSYNQNQILHGDVNKTAKEITQIIESSESESSDNTSGSNDSSNKSLPSTSNAESIESVHSEKSLPGSDLSIEIQNTSRKNTSGGMSERTALQQELANKAIAYQNIVKAIRSCNPSHLKDGGKGLRDRMNILKEELLELRKKYKRLEADEGEDPIEIVPARHAKPIFSTKDQVTANLGKKGLETHRINQALTVDALVTLHDSLKTCPTPDTFETDPNGLNVDLMPHQKHALAWLLWREQQRPHGGILADDMGLGKTLTMIALVLRSAEYKGDVEDDREPVKGPDGSTTYPGKTLVVCPASLVGQWEKQIQQHCRKNLLKVLIHHGKPRELQAKKLAKYDIVITTYGVVAEENKIILGKDRKGALFRVRWERVILDEAHIIRNPKTQKAVAACEIESMYRWCLTGTPVHNKELDMYSLLKFLQCSPFDDLMIWKRWVDNKSAQGLQRLNTVVKSILLRRTKEDLKAQGELQDLPTKDIKTVYVELDEDEEKVYHEVLAFSKNLLAQYVYQKEEKKGFLEERMAHIQNSLKKVDEVKTHEILVLLLRLRQLCCLPGLIHSMLEKDICPEDGIEAETAALEDIVTQVKRLSIGGPGILKSGAAEEKVDKILVDSNPVFDMSRQSKKIQAVLDILEEVLDTNDKIVIVSQWTSLLKTLETHIRRLKIGIVTLDGSVPVKSRSKIVEDFNNSKTNVRIILLSLNAGGVGLNLIGGNRLIIFEPHWNPQLESQACDRIYRVGQKKSVYVYKIICKDTIEEKIEKLQQKKMLLADNVLKGELKKQASKLSLQDIMEIFDLKKS